MKPVSDRLIDDIQPLASISRDETAAAGDQQSKKESSASTSVEVEKSTGGPNGGGGGNQNGTEIWGQGIGNKMALTFHSKIYFKVRRLPSSSFFAPTTAPTHPPMLSHSPLFIISLKLESALPLPSCRPPIRVGFAGPCSAGLRLAGFFFFFIILCLVSRRCLNISSTGDPNRSPTTPAAPIGPRDLLAAARRGAMPPIHWPMVFWHWHN
jgi:hypothetical protein